MNNVDSHDAGEESVAELVMSVNFTKLDRELRELREVKAAIRRLRNGRYGKRVECNAASDEDDCRRNPMVCCCIRYQTRRAPCDTGL